MHNGGIADFHLIKRRLQAELLDEIFNIVQGNTGRILPEWEWETCLLSKYRFGVGVCVVSLQGEYVSIAIMKCCADCSQLPDAKAKSFTHQTLQRAMLDTIATLNNYADLAGTIEVGSPYEAMASNLPRT